MNDYPLLNFDTESFSFRLFSNTIEEQQMIKEFQDDENIKRFLPDFMMYIEDTQNDLEQGFVPIRYTTIAYFENRPVGLITLFDMENEFVFSHGIRPIERGKRFSSKIKKEVYDYVFRTFKNIEKITVFISVDNENNLNSLKKITYDEIEKVWNPRKNQEFYKVSNHNPYLEKSIKNM